MHYRTVLIALLVALSVLTVSQATTVGVDRPADPMQTNTTVNDTTATMEATSAEAPMETRMTTETAIETATETRTTAETEVDTSTETTPADADTSAETDEPTTGPTMETPTPAGSTTTTEASGSARPDAEEGGPNDDRETANRLGTPAEVDGVFPGEGDSVDWYAFEVNAGQSVQIITYSWGVGSPTIYGPDGNEIDVSFTSATADSTKGFEAPSTGTYYVRFSDSGAGEYYVVYSLWVRLASPDSFESNENQGSAVRIDRGDERSGTITEGDEDWFAIDAEAGDQIAALVELQNDIIGPGQDVRIDLYAPNGSRIGEPTAEAPREETLWKDSTTASQAATVQRAGTYYVRVSGACDGDCLVGFSRYGLTVDVSEIGSSGGGSVGGNGFGGNSTDENVGDSGGSGTDVESTENTDTPAPTDASSGDSKSSERLN